MRRVVGIREVRVEGHELIRGQHALVDHDLRGKAAHVEVVPLREALVLAERMARALPDQIELALERVPFEPVARSEEHTSELQSRENLVCRLLLEKKKQ